MLFVLNMDLIQCLQNPRLYRYISHSFPQTQKVSTLRRRLVSIGVVHKLKGHYLDTKHPIIIENLMGIKKKKRKPSNRQKTYINQSLKTNN